MRFLLFLLVFISFFVFVSVFLLAQDNSSSSSVAQRYQKFGHPCKAFCPSEIGILWSSGPQTFWLQGLVSWKTIFPWAAGVWGGGFGMIQAYCIQVHFLFPRSP